MSQLHFHLSHSHYVAANSPEGIDKAPGFPYNISAGPNPSIVADVGPASKPPVIGGFLFYGRIMPSGSLRLASRTNMESSSENALSRPYLDLDGRGCSLRSSA